MARAGAPNLSEQATLRACFDTARRLSAPLGKVDLPYCLKVDVFP